jgi:hypothetical protein
LKLDVEMPEMGEKKMDIEKIEKEGKEGKK